RDRRPQGLCAADGTRDRAFDGGYPSFAVCGPAQGHLVHRRHFRAGDAGLVHRHQPPRHRGHCASAGHPCCAQSVPGDHLSLERGMLTWRKGEEMMDKIRLEVRLRSKDLLERLKADPPLRIPGTGVVLGRMTTGVPLSLTQNLKHNHVLHEKVLLVAVTITETPRVADEERVVVTPISDEFTRAELRFGFMEQPDVPKGL